MACLCACGIGLTQDAPPSRYIYGKVVHIYGPGELSFKKNDGKVVRFKLAGVRVFPRGSVYYARSLRLVKRIIAREPNLEPTFKTVGRDHVVGTLGFEIGGGKREMGESDVSSELLEAGLARLGPHGDVLPGFAAAYQEAEARARKHRRGCWANYPG